MVDERVRLGALGLGASPFGNLYRSVTEEDAAQVVDEMWAGGVRYFDTAPHYGLGLSEIRLGRALARRPRDEFVVSTKVGRLLVARSDGRPVADTEGFVVESHLERRWDFTAAGVEASLAASRERLGLERTDVVYLHDPEDHLDVALAEGVPALAAMRERGEISAIGVGSKSPAAITRIIETGLIDVVMLAGRYTLLDQSALEDVLPAAAKHGVDVVAVGIYNSGILATSRPDENSMFEYEPVTAPVLDRARRLAAACAEFGVELPHAAMHFPLRHPSVVNVTVGIGRPRHVASTLRWADEPVPDALWTRLADEDLIPGVPA